MEKVIIKKTKDSPFLTFGNHIGTTLLSYEHGTTKDFSMGISIYTETEFSTPGIHDVQEVFYVLEGSGYLKLENEEFYIEAGDAFVVKPNTYHTMKKIDENSTLKLIWIHS